MNNVEIIGSVACYGNVIDNLIVNRKYRYMGYGKQLLLWGMQNIRNKNKEPIVLHVAEWNKDALMLYVLERFDEHPAWTNVKVSGEFTAEAIKR